MEIKFDTAKNLSNEEKHGVSLAEAVHIDWDSLLAKPDERQSYGENRIIGYAYIGLRLHCVVYIDRLATRRIISLRKANSREVKKYAEA